MVNKRSSNVATSGCVIDDASMRAVTVLDIERMLEHMNRRMQHNPNIFKVKRPWGDNWGMVDAVLENVQDVCLYDICQYLVMPACLARQKSIMEEMSNKAAAPDFYVSQYVQLMHSATHRACAVCSFWAESVHNSISYLKQHSKDQGLESPAGWSNGEYYDGKQKEHPQFLGGRYARCECTTLHVRTLLSCILSVCRLGVWICY